MRNATLWRALLGVEKTVIESIEFDEDAGELAAFPWRMMAWTIHTTVWRRE